MHLGLDKTVRSQIENLRLTASCYTKHSKDFHQVMSDTNGGGVSLAIGAQLRRWMVPAGQPWEADSRHLRHIKRMRIVLVMCSGDNKGLNECLGFTRGFNSNVFSFCRTCFDFKHPIPSDYRNHPLVSRVRTREVALASLLENGEPAPHIRTPGLFEKLHNPSGAHDRLLHYPKHLWREVDRSVTGTQDRGAWRDCDACA
jgi:hypothetical protein